jgi:hypothetical protein
MSHLLILFSFFPLILSSHIFSQPSLLLPENQKFASDFHFFFSLETPLYAGDFLYLKFPFFSNILSGQLSTSLDPGTFNSNTVSLTRTAGIDPEHFFLLSVPLLSGTWYRLFVKLSADSYNYKNLFIL